MNAVIQKICESLEDLAKSILKSYTSNVTLTETWGWSMPPLNRQDLAELSENIVSKLRDFTTINIDEELEEKLQEIPKRIKLYKVHNLPYLFNGNGNHGSSVYFSLLEWINSNIEPLFKWEILQDNKALPTQLARRLRSIQSDLEDISPDKVELETRIKLIQEATEAAESLPTDLERLKEAHAKVSKLSTDAAELYGKIDTYFKEAEKSTSTISNKKDEADKLVQQCEEAYRITTTKGLAAAFDLRAKKLSQTMWVWVGGLLLSLVAGGLIGASRFESLAKSLQVVEPKWGVIWMDFILSIIGLAAPIWFAWIATKQISQRFRLAEDYAFKASVAKAYEGYRKEAARIDEAFEARLFSSALTRLEEAPLRLIEFDNHGSPWHEFFDSAAFQKALHTMPELKEKFLGLAKKSLSILGKTEKNNGGEEV